MVGFITMCNLKFKNTQSAAGFSNNGEKRLPVAILLNNIFKFAFINVHSNKSTTFFLEISLREIK